MLYGIRILCLLIVHPLSIHASATEAAEARLANEELCHAASVYTQTFGPFVARDPGYKYFSAILENAQQHCSLLPDFEEYTICSALSNTRCATCYAMVVGQCIDPDVFSEALQQCDDSEIYQIFVAADSYFQGKEATPNFQILRQNLQSAASPEVLAPTGSLHSNHEWLSKKIHSAHDSIFSQQFSWLQTWEHSRNKLTLFLTNTTQCPTNSLIPDLLAQSKDYPYFLHHLEKADILQYAYIFIPALNNILHFVSLYTDLRDSLPFDPHKKEVLAIIDTAFSHTVNNHPDDPASLSAHLAQVTWDIFSLLGVHITPEQWDHSKRILHAFLPQQEDGIPTQNSADLLAFQPQNTVRVAPHPMTKYAYYSENFAPVIFEKVNTLLVEPIGKIMEDHASDRQLKSYSSSKAVFLKNIAQKDFRLSQLATTVNSFLIMRCTLLWSLAKTPSTYAHFWPVYGSCTRTEKKALYVNARRLRDDNPIKKAFTNVKFSENTKHLDRMSLKIYVKP